VKLHPGQTLFHYRLIEKIGEGGMGVVWKAVDTALDREVAIKILPDTFANDAERMARFEREAKLLGSLNHPNIATVYGLHEAEGSRFISMELIPGEDVAQRLARGALPIDEASNIACQIAEALEAAHERGVIHRDLKPANVRLTADGAVKVLDFGLAKTFGEEPGRDYDPDLSPTVTSDRTRTGVILGTAAYMSPEQARGKPLDSRTDVWAFGCLLFECLAGRKAFPGETISDTLAAVLKSDPDWAALPPETSEPLRRLLHRCLAKEPRRRLRSLGDARLEIEEAPQEHEKPSAPSGWPPRLVLPVVVAALAIIAACLVWINLGPEASEADIAFQRLTYQRGSLSGARFTADGRSIVYSGAWEGQEGRLRLQRSDSAVPIAFEPSNSRAVAVSSKGDIAVIMPTEHHARLSQITPGTLATVPLTGGTPRVLQENVLAMDWDPSGERFALVRETGNRRQLEFPSGQVIYETLGHILNPRVSPSADSVAFLDHPLPDNNRGFVAIAVPGGKIRTLTIEHERMTGLAWSPDGAEIWFSGEDEQSEALFAVSLSGRERILRRMPGSIRLHDVDRNGRALVSTVLSDISIAARAPEDPLEREFPWLSESLTTDMSPDGESILFSERSLEDILSYEVWLRRLDGSAPVRLGPGTSYEFSSDGKWVLSRCEPLSSPITLLPTGAGEAHALQNDLGVLWASWAAGDESVVLAAVGSSGEVRLYLQQVAAGPPRLLSDEPVQASLFRPCKVSPDGRQVAVLGEDGFMRLVPLDGGQSSVVPGAEQDEVPLRWNDDGQSLFVWRWGFDLPARVYLLDVETGERRLWREFIPADPAGVTGILSMALTPDGRAYAYSYGRSLETLYLLTGLE